MNSKKAPLKLQQLLKMENKQKMRKQKYTDYSKQFKLMFDIIFLNKIL